MKPNAQRIFSIILIVVGLLVGFIELYLYMAYAKSSSLLLTISLLFLSVGALNMIVEDTTKK